MINMFMKQRKYTIISTSPSATRRFGEKVGKRLGPGAAVALIGELGCGKTLFTKGLCKGLGINEALVSSPTFILVNEYQGRLPVFHMDLYRLLGTPGIEEFGIADYLYRAREGVLVIEWAETILSLLSDYLLLEFKVLSSRAREIVITDKSGKYENIVSGASVK